MAGSQRTVICYSGATHSCGRVVAICKRDQPRVSCSCWMTERSANVASTPRSASATASAASRVKPPTKIANALSAARSLALSQCQVLSKITARLR